MPPTTTFTVVCWGLKYPQTQLWGMSESAPGQGDAGTTTDAQADNSTECPTCGRDDFKSRRGMRSHHTSRHGESLRLIEFECTVCGETDEKEPHHYNEDGPNYCSHACQGKDLDRKQEVKCAWCGGDLVRERSEYEKSENFFCGDKDCRSHWQRENVYGENHPQFKPDYQDSYGPNWDRQAAKARQRDNYECQICGVPQEEFDRALHVHHLTPRREFMDESGYDYKQANRIDNLVTLCESCHGKYGDWVVLPLD